MLGRWAKPLWLATIASVCLASCSIHIHAESLTDGWPEGLQLPTAMEVAEAAMRDLMNPGAHIGLQKRRFLQEEALAPADAPSPADALDLVDASAAEAPLPRVNLAPEVAQVEQLASHDLQQAGALGKSFLQRMGQGVQSVNQQMRFPNPKNGPTPEYIVSKIEDKLQEKAPLIQQKVFKIANDAYQHVDFSAIIDRALALSKDNILGAWPGQNPFGFNLDDRNFCLFAVPVLNGAPKEFNKMLKKGPLDNLDLEALPEPNFYVKKPTALVAAEKNMKADSSKIEKQMQDFVRHALPSDVGADVSSKSLPSSGNKFVLNGLQSVANATGKSAVQESGDNTPEIRTMVADGKNWACTPFEPTDVSNPAALSLVQTSMPGSSKTASGLPEMPNPSSAFPSSANDLSGKSGRRLLQNDAAEPTAKTTISAGHLPDPSDSPDTINPAEGKVIDPFYGMPTGKAQTTNPFTGEDKFPASAESYGGYGDMYGGYGSGYGGAYGLYDDSMDFSAFSPGGAYGSLPPVRRPPLVTYNAETGGVTIRPPTSLLQSLGTHVDKFIQGNTGIPFFDCIGVRDAPPLNRFVSLASKDIESLSRHFLSYLQTSNGRPIGFQIVNPFNRDAAPINVNFAQQKPYFQLPDTGRPGPGSNPFYNFAQNNNLPRLPNMPQPPRNPGGPGQPGPGIPGPGNNFAQAQHPMNPPQPGPIPTRNNADFGGHDWQSEQVAARAYDAAAAAAVAQAPAQNPAQAVEQAPAPEGSAPEHTEIVHEAPKELPMITAAAYDGYLSSCQVIVGSIPHADGTFDKTSDLSTVVLNGFFTLPALEAVNTGVAYVVPAAKGNDYPKLDGQNTNPGFCYDMGMLLPEYNPLAVLLPTSPSSTVLAASPLSTVLVFGLPLGLRQAQLQSAFGIDPSLDINTLDALAATMANPSGPAAHVLRQSIKINNAVSVGANLLSNDSSTYASYAVTMNQAIAHQALSSMMLPLAQSGSDMHQRRLLQAGGLSVELSDPATVSKVLNFAHQSVVQSSDPTVRDSVSPAVNDAFITAASNAIAAANAQTDKAVDAAEMEKTSYLVQTKVVDALEKLVNGELSMAEFNAATSPQRLLSELETTQLPGNLRTAGASKLSLEGQSHKRGLSKGAIIGIVIAAVVVAAVLVAVLAMLIKRQNQDATQAAPGVNASGGSGRVSHMSFICRC
eukprot:jgi/Botrbrau1/2979/Bobra.0026s0042.2